MMDLITKPSKTYASSLCASKNSQQVGRVGALASESLGSFRKISPRAFTRRELAGRSGMGDGNDHLRC